MYIVNESDNQLDEINETTFFANDIKEREHIEEWIRKNPDILGEELLIIGHEYDKFEVNERLDLLAIDKDGSLVIIEVKRDNTGGHVDFQALKYASYCSRLSPSDILEIYKDYIKKNDINVDALDEILSFLNLDEKEELNNILNSTQRIIVIGKDIDKRILSVCAWLNENNINVKCVSIKSFKIEDKIIIDVNQIVPPYRLEDYYINKKVRNQQNKLNVDSDVSTFLKVVANEINRTTDYYVSYSGTRSYIIGRQFLRKPLKFIFGYGKRKRELGISIESYKREGQEILTNFYEMYGEELEKELDLVVEFEQGGKRSSEKYSINLIIPVEDERDIQQYTDIYLEKFICFKNILESKL
ncbi:hypothetical protein SAMN04487944_1278 [Gracilibacillus ureilyticus]|uniref:DUF91 domain-containing protein n=1 Tax=Gracilibacillus ureilyticus TaxID=531814 RepID=A0A1H9VSP7_9BACI|nr:hypothetical protein [Gracilibacillus ureilyticus]SES24569.1 hypothetical protein SAMN04487944_1278 [Gracilibacillus ureilyticus]